MPVNALLIVMHREMKVLAEYFCILQFERLAKYVCFCLVINFVYIVFVAEAFMSILNCFCVVTIIVFVAHDLFLILKRIKKKRC